MICNETKFKDDEVCVIRLLRMIGISGVGEIGRALKSKSSSLMISFNNDSGVDCFEIRMKSAQEFGIKSLSLSLSLLLSLFKRCSKVYKVSRI